MQSTAPVGKREIWAKVIKTKNADCWHFFCKVISIKYINKALKGGAPVDEQIKVYKYKTGKVLLSSLGPVLLMTFLLVDFSPILMTAKIDLSIFVYTGFTARVLP